MPFSFSSSPSSSGMLALSHTSGEIQTKNENQELLSLTTRYQNIPQSIPPTDHDHEYYSYHKVPPAPSETSKPPCQQNPHRPRLHLRKRASRPNISNRGLPCRCQSP